MREKWPIAASGICVLEAADVLCRHGVKITACMITKLLFLFGWLRTADIIFDIDYCRNDCI